MNDQVICIIDKALPSNQDFYEKLKAKLNLLNISLIYTQRPTEETREIDVIILAAPVEQGVFKDTHVVLGLNNVNRKERLVIANKTIPLKLTARWASPQNEIELETTLKEWNAFEYVFKYDWSASRKGVQLIKYGVQDIPDDYSYDKDIIMEYLNDDPNTYKVDLFCGVTLNSWVLRTKNITDPDFKNYTANPFLFDVPDNIRISLECLSMEFLKYGSCYISIDMMRFQGSFKIIEINTNSVGRNIAWKHFASNYLSTYPCALQKLLNYTPKLRKLKDLKNLRDANGCLIWAEC